MSKFCLIFFYFVFDTCRRLLRRFQKALRQCRGECDANSLGEEEHIIVHLWSIADIESLTSNDHKRNSCALAERRGSQRHRSKPNSYLRDERKASIGRLSTFVSKSKLEMEKTETGHLSEVNGGSAETVALRDLSLESEGRRSDDRVGVVKAGVSPKDFITAVNDSLQRSENDMKDSEEIHQPFKEKASLLSSAKTEGLGFLVFEAMYNEEKHRLTIKLEKAVELPSKGRHKSFGIVVKASRISSSGRAVCVHRTRASLTNINPTFNESFDVEIRTRKSRSYIRLSLFESERQSPHEAIGHVLLPVRNAIQICQRHRLPLLYQTIPVRDLGQIHMSLMYQPSRDKLTVGILRGRRIRLRLPLNNRIPSKLNFVIPEECEVYAKVTLMCCGEKIKSQYTRYEPASPEPRFEQNFEFVVPLSFLDDSSVVVGIFLRSEVTKKHVILGRVTSGPYICIQGGQFTHWGQMLQEGKTVIRWRELYL